MAAIDYGTGPNTTTGDTIPVALGKLRDRLIAAGFDPALGDAATIAVAVRRIEVALDAAETAYVPPLPGTPTPTPTPAPVFTVQPSISPVSGVAGATFTASDGSANNTTGYTRRWLLNGTSIGTGLTVVPVTAGALVLEVTATGPGGPTIATSAAVAVSSGNTPTPTPTPTIADPIMYVVGASLESNGQRGLMTPVAYGYSPQGPLQWSNYLANKRLFYIQMAWLNQEPYNYTRPSAYATGGARYNEGNTGGYSVNEQVDLAIASAQRLPAGKQKVVFYSGGRNDISSASTYVPKELANIDKLLAVFDLVIVPGLWKRDVAAAAGWQSGGSNRGYVDAINTRMATDLAARGNKVIHVPLQAIMCESTGDQNPKPGYLVDGDTHLSVKGAYESGKAIFAAIANRFVGASDFGNIVTVSGTGGTPGGGTTGTLPNGFTSTKDPTVSAAFSIPAAGSVAMTITRAVTQATVAEGATLTGPSQAVASGGSYRMRIRVQVAPTPLPIVVAAYLAETTAATPQRAYAMWPLRTGESGKVSSVTAYAAVDPLDASNGLDMWLETPDLIVKPASGATIAPVVTASVNQGEVASFTVTALEWSIAKVADPLPTVSFTTASVSRAETNSGPNVYPFEVTRSTSSGSVDVASTFNAGGTDAADYTGGMLPAGGTLSFGPGETSKTINISVNGDTIDEANETFSLSLTVPDGYAGGNLLSASGIIGNDDSGSGFAFRERWTEPTSTPASSHVSDTGHTWAQISTYGATVIGGSNYARWDRGTGYMINSYAPSTPNYDLRVPIRFRQLRSSGVGIRMAQNGGVISVGYSEGSGAWAAHSRTSANNVSAIYIGTAVTIVLQQWYAMEIRVRGDTFEQYIDGVRVSPAAVAFPANPGPFIGLTNLNSYSTNGTQGMEYGEMTVTEYPA